MKKLTKSVVSLALVVVMLVCFCGTAFAAGNTPWGRNFPTLRINSVSNYTFAVQAFLARYNPITRAHILDSGGVDGSFGEGTYDAVYDFEAAAGITRNHVVEDTTWDAMYNCLSFHDYSDYRSYYRVIGDEDRIEYNSNAVSRFSQAVSGAVVTAWYAYTTGGTEKWFSSF